MAIYANFIGVHKHQASDIRDLPGAERDAKALWALFCDAIPDLVDTAKLIINDKATHAEVNEAINTSLEAATEDDTVIITFSGHGSPDHRLAVFDTERTKHLDTTISMQELADRFKASKAKNILCILDCCFSGEAPARVLEDVPIPRDGMLSLESLSGKGRVIIAASRHDEPAYELPGRNHGILTAALIDVLLASDTALAVNESIDKAMDIVRAESGKFGVVQTPVMLGTVEGGFKLPVFKIGDHYSKAFPEILGIKISNDPDELSQFGIPSSVTNIWKANFANGLNDLQLEAVNEYRLLDGKSLLVVAPTSSGKTFIGELAAAQGIQGGRKAVFLLPYKALVNEKYDQFQNVYGDTLGIKIIRCSGDNSDQVNEFVRGKYDIAFLTYEMFLGIAVSNPALMNAVGLVVVDEVQFVSDDNRGINLELLLTFLITLRERNIVPQIVALSAVIGSINDFDSWLGINKLVTDKRPIPLVEGVLDRNGVYQYRDPDTGESKTEQLLPSTEIVQRNERPSSQDVIVPLVKGLLSANPNERVIIFRTSRGAAQGAANYLANDLGLPSADEALQLLPQTDLSRSSLRLQDCLRGGTAFHNTNLSRQEREVVEREYRKRDGKIKALASTTTLAAGINTPASTVIIAEYQFRGGDDSRDFYVAEYKNMAGRAGRMGYNEKGRSILLVEHSTEREYLYRRYVEGVLEPLKSSFHLEEIETWILRLLAQVNIPVPEGDIVHLLANTYGGYIAVKADPDWRQTIVQKLQQSLAEIKQLGLVEEADGKIRLSLLGQACGRSSLSFTSLKQLISSLQSVGASITTKDMMAVVQTLPEMDRVYIPLNRRGSSEAGWPRSIDSYYKPGMANVLQRSAADMNRYYARCKKALILSDWIDGVTVDSIEQAYSTPGFYFQVDYGDIRSCADGTRFFLNSAFQIALVMYPAGAIDPDSISRLIQRLEIGLPEDALDLLNAPIDLTRGECLECYRADLKTVDALRDASIERLNDLIGNTRAAELKAALTT